MRLRLFRRRPAEEPVAVIATYPISRRTAKVVLLKDGRVRWTCDCEVALRSARGNLPPWCKHIEKASAKRAIERLFGETRVAKHH
ncbi:MAG TPA: hypothetical protein VG994_05390 [Steroidobacteraceae bacterium]|nr:hypothetical protein [Steroidobacteraceae bacterium]